MKMSDVSINVKNMGGKTISSGNILGFEGVDWAPLEYPFKQETLYLEFDEMGEESLLRLHSKVYYKIESSGIKYGEIDEVKITRDNADKRFIINVSYTPKNSKKTKKAKPLKSPDFNAFDNVEF